MNDDVPSRIDLRDPEDAARWVAEADVKRPWRADVRAAIAALIHDTFDRPRILELGPGPGLLAEAIVRTSDVARLTLLDFSEPMLQMCRDRLGPRDVVELVVGDFRNPAWVDTVERPFDVVVSMQAIHEIRHKRHVAGLYQQVASVLVPGGMLVVCDHAPPDDRLRMTTLHSTEREQHAAMAAAGLTNVTTHLVRQGLYVVGARRP